MHRVGVSAPDIAGADDSNLPAPESFLQQSPNLILRVAYFGQYPAGLGGLRRKHGFDF
jgi:hypothetical protein